MENMDVWHHSFLPAEIPPMPAPVSDTGRVHLQKLREVVKKKPVTVTEPLQASWAATPEAFKRLVLRSAGLPESVAKKIDRELSEVEKAQIRAAVRRLLDLANPLVAM